MFASTTHFDVVKINVLLFLFVQTCSRLLVGERVSYKPRNYFFRLKLNSSVILWDYNSRIHTIISRHNDTEYGVSFFENLLTKLRYY